MKKCVQYYIVRDYINENKLYDFDKLTSKDIKYFITFIPGLEKYLKKKLKSKISVIELKQKTLKFITRWLINEIDKCE